ncbi:hypothetical protein [uncultured Chryseobacterium sp.]|uniref:hypothetical protein n=1 Tax=uncultured Chryseobacterium sp. TaxID=259322 RepID=UPI003748B567
MNILDKNIIKGILFILFLITLSVYFIFFKRNLKLEYTEKCPCKNQHYTLYQYRDTGKLFDDSKFDFTNYKTFKLENNLGFTIDKLIHIDANKLDDTISLYSNLEQSSLSTTQFYWDCKNKEVWISRKQKLSFK